MDELELWKKDNERLEQLLPELGCLLKIDSIMTAYAPHKLSKFGVSPVLPAIYALQVIVEEGNLERCEEAIVLLQYIHSHFPDVSLHAYIDLLVDLKTKTTVRGVFSASDDEEKYAILDKFFPLEACYLCNDSEAEEYTSIEEYCAHMHGVARSGIEEVITSQQECLKYQCNQLLCPGHALQLHGNLLKNLKSYLSDIRSQLPCPKLFQWSETYRSREQCTRANHTAEWDVPEDTEAILSPRPQQRTHTNGREVHEAAPIPPSNQLLLNESHPAREEVVLATRSTVSMPVTSVSSHRRSKRLLGTKFEKETQKFTRGASSSSEAPQRKVKTTSMLLRSSTILTDGDDQCHSENATASTSSGMDTPITYRPPRHKRLASKKLRSNSKSGTRKDKRDLAATRQAPESRKSKLSGRTTLSNIRTVKNLASINVVSKITPSEDATIRTCLVEEEDVTQDSDKVSRVSRHEKRRKHASTESDSDNNTDTLAPARKQAKLSSSTQSSEYPLRKQLTLKTRAQGKLEQSIRRLQKRRRWQYTPSIVVSKVSLVQKSTNGKKVKSKSTSQTCSEHQKQNSKLPLPLAPTISYPSDDVVATHTLEYSQPETINLFDEEVEFTQNGTQYNYGPLEKVAYEASLSDRESETVVSDSTASLSPIFLKKPSLSNMYGFLKRR